MRPPNYRCTYRTTRRCIHCKSYNPGKVLCIKHNWHALLKSVCDDFDRVGFLRKVKHE